MNPKQDGFFMPAEWHPHTGCWMAWPCHMPTWEAIGLQKAREAYSQVALAISKFEPVTMLVNPGDVTLAREMLGPNIRIESIYLDDSWTRDTGPTFLLNTEGELAGVDWLHNAWGGNYESYEYDAKIAEEIIKLSSAKHYKAPLVMEGGSLHVDGEGTVLTSRECLLNSNRNPNLSQEDIESQLRDNLNIEKVIWLNKGLVGDETNGHIDEIACFIGPGKVLALITSDTKDDNYEILQENLAILKSATDARGRELEVYTIEQPPATYLDNERLTLSYINFYMANFGLVIPGFGYKEHDKLAYDLFVKLFPGYEVVQLPVINLFSGGGGIHCITQQQPKKLA
ncbi:MAG: agmatine deiminase family protein [Legionellaceae bacterium]|nr:agmatine deiminase family protein [Legionellaceae bacterium]